MEDTHGDLLTICWNGGIFPSEGAKHYVRRDKEIPEPLLPGRRLQGIKKYDPKYFEKLINTNWLNAAPWWVKIMCS